MTEVSVSKSIKAPAEITWEKLSSFKGIEDFSPVERSVTVGEGVGATRTCYMPDGAEIYELLEEVKNNEMEMQYRITEGPFPIQDYVSTVKVEKISSESSKITWSCKFDSEPEVKDEMAKLFEGFYNIIINSLEKVVNN